MRILLLLLLLFSILTPIGAQTPYALFNSKSELFFNQPDLTSELLGLKPDSINASGTDTIYYHYRILGNGTCGYSAQMPGWLGIKTIRNISNDYIFFNNQNDSLILKPTAAVGSSWNFYKYSNGNYIKATVSSKQYEATFNGQFDTVKTISFQTYNTSNAPITNDYNTKVFKFSKSQGVIRLGNMYDFPVDTSVNKRCFGKRLTIFDLCNHNVGDVIETNGYDSFYAQNSPYTQTYRMYTYLSKVNPTSDSVIYTVNVAVQSHSVYPTSATVVSTSTQTIYIGNLDSILIKQMPGQFKNMDISGLYAGSAISYFFNPAGANCIEKFRVTYMDCIAMVGNSDTCLGPSVSCWQPVQRTFIKGMGNGFFGYAESMMTAPNSGNPNFSNYPIHSNSANDNCGSLIPLNIKNSSNETIFRVYPNPVSQTLIIDSGWNAQISEIHVTDLLGKEIIHVANKNEMDVSLLMNGIYFIKIKTGQGEFSQKFIKE